MAALFVRWTDVIRHPRFKKLDANDKDEDACVLRARKADVHMRAKALVMDRRLDLAPFASLVVQPECQLFSPDIRYIERYSRTVFRCTFLRIAIMLSLCSGADWGDWNDVTASLFGDMYREAFWGDLHTERGMSHEWNEIEESCIAYFGWLTFAWAGAIHFSIVHNDARKLRRLVERGVLAELMPGSEPWVFLFNLQPCVFACNWPLVQVLLDAVAFDANDPVLDDGDEVEMEYLSPVTSLARMSCSNYLRPMFLHLGRKVQSWLPPCGLARSFAERLLDHGAPYEVVVADEANAAVLTIDTLLAADTGLMAQLVAQVQIADTCAFLQTYGVQEQQQGYCGYDLNSGTTTRATFVWHLAAVVAAVQLAEQGRAFAGFHTHWDRRALFEQVAAAHADGDACFDTYQCLLVVCALAFAARPDVATPDKLRDLRWLFPEDHNASWLHSLRLAVFEHDAFVAMVLALRKSYFGTSSEETLQQHKQLFDGFV